MNNEEKILLALEGLTSTVSTLVTKVDKLEQDLTEVKQDLTEVKQNLTEVKQDVTSIKKTVVKIEIDHGEKLGALFDGYDMNYKVSQDIRTDVSGLKETQEKQDLNIKWLNDNKLKTV